MSKALSAPAPSPREGEERGHPHVEETYQDIRVYSKVNKMNKSTLIKLKLKLKPFT